MIKDSKKNYEIYPNQKKDRRLLSYAPDFIYKRHQIDRRGIVHNKPANEGRTSEYIDRIIDTGRRYYSDFNVKIYIKRRKHKHPRARNVECIDLSVTGILLKIPHIIASHIKTGQKIKLKFNIPSGTMHEGYEGKAKIMAYVVRYADKNESENDEDFEYVAFKFERTLTQYFSRQKWSSEITISSIFMSIIVIMIILMRVQSVVYFVYDVILYSYSILTALYLLSRYLFAAFYRSVPAEPEFVPGVSIIIPCFNEEKWIQKTIISCLDQYYPLDKLEIIIVDDYSSDNSVQKIEEIIYALKKECVQYNIEERIKFIKSEKNSGKRAALAKGVEIAKHELVAFVDSDSFLRPTAIRNLVQPFRDHKVGGVTGRTDVENKWTNYITKMQTVRYYVAFRILKAAESIFDTVTCLSGPISCYRKDLVLENKKAWLEQKFLGHPATFGDDRSMTNFILRHHRTVYQDTAICSTIVPSEFNIFLKQQMRWKRSWLRESLIAGKYMWRKEPFQALSFYAGLLVPILSPVVFVYNLIIVPVMYMTFPAVFILGMLLMSFLMSFVYLLQRKSRIWIYGFAFCLFYEFILLWQMPVACVTFWKSTWGTRKTKNDIEEEQRKKRKKGNNKIVL